MKDRHRFFLVVGGLTASSAVTAVAFTGCGGDDTVSMPDAAMDVTVDTPIDRGSDGPGMDAADGGGDVVVDVGPDIIVTNDSGDAAALYAFAGQVATALCGKFSQCCMVMSDAGFDNARCVSDLLPYGWRGSSVGSNLIDGGNIQLNLGASQACLADIAAIDCNANVVTNAEATGLYTDCYTAYQGTVSTGGACSDSIECQAGLFCGLPTDGGTMGTCVALKTSGQPCGDYGVQMATPDLQQTTLALSECSYRGSGNTMLSCEIYTLDAGVPLPPSQWTCFQEGTTGAGCSYDVDCTGKICDPNNFVCITSEPATTPAECAIFIPDAGGGG